jgi:hypothetical protein
MLADLARLFGIPQASHGYPQAVALPGVTVIPRG